MRVGNNIAFRRIMKKGEISENAATYKGVALKSIFFLLMTVAGAIGSLAIGYLNPEAYVKLFIVAIFSTTILSLIAMLAVNACKIAGTLYCLAEGTLIGATSLLVSLVGEGCVSVALLATLLVFAVVTLLYVTNVVKVNNGFMRFLSLFAISFMLFVILYYIYSLIANVSLDGVTIFLSLISIFLASLYLFFDLEHIRQVVEGGYDKRYEWNAAFGLTFTLIWLYVEMLRLILIIFARSNRN